MSATITRSSRRTLLVAVLALSACKHGHSEVVGRAQALIDRVYACTDLACAKAVEDELYTLNAEVHGLSADESDFLFMSAGPRVRGRVEALEPPRDNPPAPPSSTAPPTTIANEKSRCASVFPQALVDRYLPGFALEESRGMSDFGEALVCQFTKDPIPMLTASVACDGKSYDAMARTIEKLTDPKLGQATRVDGIGRGAYSLRTGELTFWATNVPCVIAFVVSPKGDPLAADVTAFAKQLDAALVSPP